MNSLSDRFFELLFRSSENDQSYEEFVSRGLLKFTCFELALLGSFTRRVLALVEKSGVYTVISAREEESDEFSDDLFYYLSAISLTKGRKVLREILKNPESFAHLILEGSDIWALTEVGDFVVSCCYGAWTENNCDPPL